MHDIKKPYIIGLDLKIDPAVQKICEIYNQCSGSTRSVMYVLLLVNILAFISVINTHRSNWITTRIASKQDNIELNEKKLIALKYSYLRKQTEQQTRYQHLTEKSKNNIAKLTDLRSAGLIDSLQLDSSFTVQNTIISDNIKREAGERDNLIRNKIENSQTVKVPILGNSFDIDNLAIVSGVSFIILLIVLKFTLTREKNNLKLAFNAITDRYTDLIEPELKDNVTAIATAQGISEKVVMAEINNIRREHHYNFLSMNEIFNLPYLTVSDKTLQNTTTGKIVTRYLFYFPYFIYLLTFVNDLSTWPEGFKVSFWHTIILYIISFIFLTIIARLSRSCNKQKLIVTQLFNKFYENNYRYQQVPKNEKKVTTVEAIFYSFVPLIRTIHVLWDGLVKKKTARI